MRTNGPRGETWSSLVIGPSLSILWAGPVSSANSDSPWQLKNAGPTINTEYHEGWATLAADGLTLYFGSNRPGGFHPANIDDHWVIGKDGKPTRYDIYVAHRKRRGDPWSKPALLPEPINSTANDHSASISADGHYLFFASDRPGGCGDLDLYVSYRDDIEDDTAWQAPRNLGCVADGGPNGRAIESCPVLRDGRVYFTASTTPDPMTLDFKVSEFTAATLKGSTAVKLQMSTAFMDAHFDPYHGYIWAGYPTGGIGGSDIWIFENAASADDPALWRSPKNLGSPINTEHEEHMPSATTDGRLMTLVSDRPGGHGGLDIYEARR